MGCQPEANTTTQAHASQITCLVPSSGPALPGSFNTICHQSTDGYQYKIGSNLRYKYYNGEQNNSLIRKWCDAEQYDGNRRSERTNPVPFSQTECEVTYGTP